MSERQINEILQCLSNRRRRTVLNLLQNRTAPVSDEEVAIHLIAEEQEKRLVDVTEDEMQTCRIDLKQSQFPVLETAGLINWEREAETVITSNHPVLQNPTFTRVIETDWNGWDDVLANLMYKRRRLVLSVLTDYDNPLSRVALARELAAHEVDKEETLDSATIDAICADLHHVHLPKLVTAGLIEYDARSGAVSYRSHPVLEENDWFNLPLTETPRAIFSVAEPSQDIWRIDGRANVIERCRALCNYADEELFLMYTDEDLIEETCLQCLQDAIDRGVEVYIGTQTKAIRDCVREELPEATLWEPRRDWMNMPPEREKVGRLLFADREAIMLGTLSKQNEHGIQTETAITGNGENNALVMLVREMLGSRLDHLDAQSEDFLEQIPF
ncbi:hypothetical protein Htur_4807 (plasmid) [Haloterrigena turkmenica DSM 5511]|uniref:DUF7344 domain-containing protein n=1 Tax=Haloterrigena turkmenica (strain ATCC 51198 / DSM 5511 / JCM 9101 / NCIMB 13204 / VKM B-1734 / 4k) TaxID=543526 RepID=D2S2H9_HALTV|nr:hypothetical protein [Haloterrigena turkmenica]ADB63576.1 hypothetical protein Htur_4807 [Haloterrigena turkmenica DSM 5511]